MLTQGIPGIPPGRKWKAPPPPPPSPHILSHDSVICTDETDTDRDSLPLGAVTPCLAPPYSRLNPSACPMISLHYPDGTIVSSKLLSQERFDWLSLQYHLHAPPCSPPFLEALCSLLQRYHPLAAIHKLQGQHLNPRHHMAMPREITQVLHSFFAVTSELFASPLNCSLLPGVTFCSPFKEDEAFGAVHDAFSFRWTGACSAHPAPVPEDMHRAVSHAVASAGHSDTPFLCFLALPSWERASWKSEDVLGSQDIQILLRLSKGHLKLVPPEESLEVTNPNKLRPTDWPLDLVVVANEGGRSKWLSAAALQEALVPAVRAVCQVPDQHVELLPPDAKTRLTRPLRHHSHARPLPSRPLPSWGSQPSLGPRDTGLPPLELWPLQPDLRQVRRYTSPTDRPLHIVEICGGLATGLHALVFYDVFWPACAGVRGVRGVRIQKTILNNPQIFKECAHASCARMQGLRARLRTPCWPARAFEDYARGWSIL